MCYKTILCSDFVHSNREWDITSRGKVITLFWLGEIGAQTGKGLATSIENMW